MPPRLPSAPIALVTVAGVVSLALLVPVAARADAPEPRAFHALLINGGGSAEENFSSHLAHLRQMLDLLARAGVPASRITVLNADGPDPGPDMAVRESEPEGFPLIAGTELGRRLASETEVESSTVPGVRALPATRAAVEHWFAAARGRLHPGDTLFLYVTDHGSQNPRDPLDNRIVLWGRRESLSVRHLQALLDGLDPGVRVVSLMSQCFSGGFAHLGDARPRGPACGYFSSTADRPAYGCYPVVAGRERVGHSFEFMEALARHGRFPDAHAAVLASDDTPDVPLRSSDVALEEIVARAARRQNLAEDRFIDGLLHQAWKDRARWEPEIRLLDRIGQSFGLTSPRSLAELDRTRERLEELRAELETHGKSWSEAQALASESLQARFFASHPAWTARVGSAALRRLTERGRRTVAAELVKALRDDTAAATDDPRPGRLKTLTERTAEADEAAYRMEVRLAVLLRMRAVLTDVAGRVYLAGPAAAADAAKIEALRRCEDLALPIPGSAPRPPAHPAFPTLDADLRIVKEVLPSWMGIEFDDGPSRRRARMGLPDGAALVVAVLPDSAAQAAGLAVGDVVLGPPGHPFRERREILIWTMLLPAGQPQPLDVLRRGRHLAITLSPRARPLKLPTPGPPQPLSAAPPVQGSTYRGVAPSALATRGPYLLFFWATWCAPCKESLPEVLAFSRQRGVPVVAITDEGRGDLDTFFARWKAPFPGNVVSDEDRESFEAYAVSGTPTFVLVDQAARVQSYAVGYSRERGLGVPGWRWDGRR